MEKSKPWQKAWCVIPKQDPLVLYMYGAPQVFKLHLSEGTEIMGTEGGEWMVNSKFFHVHTSIEQESSVTLFHYNCKNNN